MNNLKYYELSYEARQKVRKLITQEYGTTSYEDAVSWANMPGNTYDEEGNLYIHGEKY